MSTDGKAQTHEDRRIIGADAKKTALSRLGNRLRKARQDSGLTQSDVAGKVGTTAQTVRNWETGKHEPPARVISELAEHYKVSEEELLENPDAPGDNPIVSPAGAKPGFPYDRVSVVPGKLSDARRAAGFTQARVSKMTGMSLSAIRRYERGSARPTTVTLEMLAGIYKKPAGWFMPLGYFTEEEDTRFRESVAPWGEKEVQDHWVMAAYDRAKPDLPKEAKERIINFIRFTHRQELSGHRDSISRDDTERSRQSDVFAKFSGRLEQPKLIDGA